MHQSADAGLADGLVHPDQQENRQQRKNRLREIQTGDAELMGKSARGSAYTHPTLLARHDVAAMPSQALPPCPPRPASRRGGQEGQWTMPNGFRPMLPAQVDPPIYLILPGPLLTV